jgi:hypothetical protein
MLLHYVKRSSINVYNRLDEGLQLESNHVAMG